MMGTEKWKPPFMPWFEQDFMGSFNVRKMAPLARLMYRSLLLEGWHSDNPPCLPNNDHDLMLMADAPSPEDWEQHKAVILQRFQQTPDGKWLFHPKALREYERARAEHNRGAAGAYARWRGEQMQGADGSCNAPTTTSTPRATPTTTPRQEKTSSSEVSKSTSDEKHSQPSEDGWKLARLMQAEILAIKPDFKITDATLRSWAETADLMLRRDSRDLGRAADLMKRVYRDDFWQKNVLCMRTFRQRFDQLELKLLGKPDPYANVKWVPR